MTKQKHYTYTELSPAAPRRTRAKFEYDGLVWTVFAHPLRSNSGKTITDWMVSYTSSEGHVVKKDETPRNRRNDESRNWGLGRE